MIRKVMGRAQASSVIVHVYVNPNNTKKLAKKLNTFLSDKKDKRWKGLQVVIKDTIIDFNK